MPFLFKLKLKKKTVISVNSEIPTPGLFQIKKGSFILLDKSDCTKINTKTVSWKIMLAWKTFEGSVKTTHANFCTNYNLVHRQSVKVWTGKCILSRLQFGISIVVHTLKEMYSTLKPYQVSGLSNWQIMFINFRKKNNVNVFKQQ